MDESDRRSISELALDILLALGDGPLHGYGIIHEIEDRTGLRSTVRSGTLYATLRDLHERELVEETDPPEGVDGRRRYYRLTPRGRRTVAGEVERLADVVRRAMELRLAPDGLLGGG